MSSPGKQPLRHLLYTIARGEGRQQGYRAIFDYFNGDVEEEKAVVKWLNRLEVSVEEGYGWAAQGFLVGGARHAALAVLNPYFGLDDLGSPAELYHALLVPVPDNQPSGHFYFALYEAAIRFMSDPSPQVQSLQNYLKGCQTIKDLTVPELDPAGLVNMSPDFLRELLVTAAHLYAGASVLEVSLPGARSDEELPRMLAMAGGAIPPSLRLTFRWATGVKPASELLVARRRSAGEGPSGAQRNLGDIYFEWLKERLDQHQFDAIREIAEDPSIISWERLRERITALPMTEAEPTRQLLDSSEILEQERAKRQSDRAADPIPQKEKTTMKRGQRSKATDSSSPGNLADVRELIQNEFEKMWESVREYLDDRLSQMDGPTVLPAESGDTFGSMPAGGPGGRDSLAGRRRRDRTIRLLAALRPEIYFLIVLLLLGGIYWKEFNKGQAGKQLNQRSAAKREGSGQASNHASPEAQAKPNTAQEGTSQGRKVDDFVAQWHEYLRTHKKEVAQLLASMTSSKSSVKVGPQTRTSLETWSKKLEKGQPLSQEEAAKTATAIFEYVHAKWAELERQENLQDNIVSLSTGEVTPEHLNAILQEYNLDFGSNPGRDDPNVQAAVALRWLGFTG